MGDMFRQMFCKIIASQKILLQKNPLFGNFEVSFGGTQNSTYPHYNIKTNAGKLKTRKSVCKRFKITSNGKIIRRQSGKQHLNEKKSKNRKNRLSSYRCIAKCDMGNISRCMARS